MIFYLKIEFIHATMSGDSLRIKDVDVIDSPLYVQYPEVKGYFEFFTGHHS